MNQEAKQLSHAIDQALRMQVAKLPQQAQPHDYWQALSRVVLGQLTPAWQKTQNAYRKARTQNYFSAEFLVGRALLNNLTNLGLVEAAREALASFGLNLNDVLEEEVDPALGNGGLGRLAACFMDSCATLNLPARGYGILYRYGLFHQSFENGFQKEGPDTWMEEPYPFLVARPDEGVTVRFSDLEVKAVPYDLPITGYGTQNVNTLRLWQAKPREEFDFHLFNEQHFTQALGDRNRAQDICRVLYPNDSTREGKALRLRQQYFFTSASLQDLIREHRMVHGDLSEFATYHCIQLNDTHPVLAIPELLRLLLDQEQMSWEEAWRIVTATFAYTNHTVMQEALEKWDCDLLQNLLPRIYELICRIDAQFRQEMAARGLYHDQINEMAMIQNNQVHMAWLACYSAYSINGVAALHTAILKKETLKAWYEIWPERFHNMTNGVTPRRWLRMCNPELGSLLTEALGSEAWVTQLDALQELLPLATDPKIQTRLLAVKQTKKEQLVAYLQDQLGIEVNPQALFDVQIKRLHEYKRQLLNALYILDLYFRVKENPEALICPRVFFFGAKAAPGYYRAKSIIKLINEIARILEADPVVAGRLKIVFVPNYCVSVGEKLFPAADLSEQISTAGLEASGTGNMKFMMNGALTLGTLDGANVEIVDSVSREHAYIFGAEEAELKTLRQTYNPHWLYETVPGLKRTLDSLTNGLLQDGGSGRFLDLFQALVHGSGWETPDVYYVLGDFEAYRAARDQAARDYTDPKKWAESAWINICHSGRFSSDRTIQDYARDIWKITPVSISDH